MKTLIAPSVLSADFSRLGEEIKAVEKAGADLIHLDVMDGHFVPNITAGPILVEAARRSTDLPLDVHLMIKSPQKYVEDFIEAGASYLSIHVEVFSSTSLLKKTLRRIRDRGVKASLVINPKTPLKKLEPFLSWVDMILIMTVQPGFGGQGFIPSCLPKIKKLRQMLNEKKLSSVPIEVDGGIKTDNIQLSAQAGANIFVAGSAIFKSKDYRQTIELMRQKAAS